MEEVSAFLQLLLNAALPILGTIVALELKTWLLKQRQLAEARLTNEQESLINGIVRTGIEAAEQSGLIGLIANTGLVKKQHAINFIVTKLAKYGIKLSADEINNRIEAGITAGWNQGPALFAGELLFDEDDDL